MVVLPMEICEYIVGLAPPMDLDTPDTVAWMGSNDGDIFSKVSLQSYFPIW